MIHRYTQILLCSLISALALTAVSCGTSRKVFTASTDYTHDVAATVAHDTASVRAVRMDSTAHTALGSAHRTEQQQQTTTEEETVTEHITEQTDSAGRKTVTTLRQIARRGTAVRQTASDAYTWRMMEDVELMCGYIDSIRHSESRTVRRHEEYNDSIVQTRERDATVQGGSLAGLIRSYLAMAVVAFLIAAAIYTYNKTS